MHEESQPIPLASSLDKRYEPLAVVRRTKSGAVLRVRDRESGATRILEQRGDGSSVDDESLVNAKRALDIEHPNIVRVRDIDRLRGGYHILRDDVGDISLRSLLDADVQISVPVVFELLDQALDALATLHDAGLWVGNLSPSDLFLTLDHAGVPGSQGTPRLVLADLGLAQRLVPDTVPAATAVFVGQLRYASPEQFDEAAVIGPASDIYGIGLIAYEILTGSHPIAGSTTSSLIAGHLFRPPTDFDQSDPEGRVPDALRDWVLARLAKAPDERGDAMGARLALDALFRSPGSSHEAELDWSALGAWLERSQAHKAQPSEPSEAPEKVEPTIAQAPTTRPLPPLPPPPPTKTVVNDGPTAMIRQVRSAVDAEADAEAEARAAQEHERRKNRQQQVRVLLEGAKRLAQTENFAASRDSLGELLHIMPDHPEALALLASVEACLKIQVEESRGHDHIAAPQGSTPDQAAPADSAAPPGDASMESTVIGIRQLVDQGRARLETDVGSTIQLSPADLQAALDAAAPPATPTPPDQRPTTEEIGTVTMSGDALAAAKARALARQATEVTMPGGLPIPTPPAGSISAPGPGSVTLPMAEIEAAKARALELYRQQQGDKDAAPLPTSGGDGEPPQMTDIREPRQAPGSVTLPMATIEAAKARHEARKAVQPTPPAPSTLAEQPTAQQPSAAQRSHLERTPTPATWSFTPPEISPPDISPRSEPVSPESTSPPPAERSPMSISDLGFGGDNTNDSPMAPATGRRSPRAEPPEGGLRRPLIALAIVLGLGAVFAGSFFLSERITPGAHDGEESSLSANAEPQAEDVIATDLPPGTVSLDVSPWAEIVSVVDASGEPAVIVGAPFTPKTLSLAPGTYTLTVRHPPSGQERTAAVDVESRGSHRVHVTLVPSVTAFFDQASW